MLRYTRPFDDNEEPTRLTRDQFNKLYAEALREGFFEFDEDIHDPDNNWDGMVCCDDPFYQEVCDSIRPLVENCLADLQDVYSHALNEI